MIGFGWQWHQLVHMQIICRQITTLQHLITEFFTGRMLFLMTNQYYYYHYYNKKKRFRWRNVNKTARTLYNAKTVTKH